MWAMGSVLPESCRTSLKLGKEAGRSYRKRQMELLVTVAGPPQAPHPGRWTSGEPG